jgi:hypothetical protein
MNPSHLRRVGRRSSLGEDVVDAVVHSLREKLELRSDAVETVRGVVIGSGRARRTSPLRHRSGPTVRSPHAASPLALAFSP